MTLDEGFKAKKKSASNLKKIKWGRFKLGFQPRVYVVKLTEAHPASVAASEV